MVGVGPSGPLVEIVVLSRHPLALALTSSPSSPIWHHSEGQPSEEGFLRMQQARVGPRTGSSGRLAVARVLNAA